MARNPRWAALPALAAVTAVGLACSGSSTETSTTNSSTTSTTASSSGASSTTTAGSGGGGGSSDLSSPVVAAPSGATQLQNGSANGATYWSYSITGQDATQVVNTYSSELTAQGYTIQNQGGGGGGWGDFGGVNAGLTANKGSTYISVQAGGSNQGPTYFEICQGPTAASVNDCENISQGPEEGDNGNSNTRPT
jgi:hypothetical protein